MVRSRQLDRPMGAGYARACTWPSERPEGDMTTTKGRFVASWAAAALALLGLGLASASAISATTPGLDPGIGNVPQGLQSDQAYSRSYGDHSVTNVFVTSRKVSCYRPEVPVLANNGPNDGYTGETAC